jgi:fumarylpyruvate hydrolase
MSEIQNLKFLFPPRVKGVKIFDSEVLFPVGKIYCIGKNYADHAKEMGGAVDKDQPFFFSKPPQAITQSNTIAFPTQTNNLHHEVELVVFIGAKCSDVKKEDAHKSIFGYGVGVDLTKRDLQDIAKKNGKPWDLSKGFDKSAPISKILQNEKTIMRQGEIKLSVNGVEKQSSDLSNMAWEVDEIISWLSKFIILHPGDIIFTGTPAGVGKLNPGDQIDASIESVGSLSFKLV